MAQIAITNIPEIDRALRRLGPKVANQVVMRAIRDAMKPMAPDIAREAPRGETGKLSQSVKVRVGRRSTKRKEILVLYAKDDFGGDRWYATFQELGFGMGSRVKKSRYQNRYEERRQEYGTRRMRGNGFMRKVFDRDKDAALTRARVLILAGVEDAVRENSVIGRIGKLFGG